LRQIQNNELEADRTAQSFPDVRLLGAEVTEMTWALNAVIDLMEKSNDPEDGQELTTLSQEIDTIRIASLSPDNTADDIKKLEFRAYTAQLQLSAFQDVVMIHGRIAEHRARKLYDVFSWASYALFAIGWVIGVLGAISGVSILDNFT
jgi:hypothetical protein